MPFDAPARDQRAEQVTQRFTELEALRTIYHGEWETISTLLMRNRKAFSSGGQPGEWQHRGVFSSEPVIAANNLAAGLYGTLTNPANRWFGFMTPDEDLNAWHRVKSWQDTVTNRVLASLMSSTSNFYEAAMPLYGDIVCFGTAVQYDELQPERQRILDKTLPLSEAVVSIGDDGQLHELGRKFRLKPRVAARTYGDRLPARVLDKADKNDTGDITFWRLISRNDDWTPGRFGAEGKPFVAVTVCEEGPSVVSVEGYHEMPGYAPRWDVDAGETWGRGVGYFALPQVRLLNLATEANVRGAQAHVDPVTLAPDERALRRNWRIHPGATLYGAMSMAGRPLVQRLPGPVGLPYGIEHEQRLADSIKEMFGFSLMQITNRSGMTPTEFLERQADRLRLLAPFLGRIQVEYLTAKISRRFAMLWRAGQLPPPPPELAGRPLEVKYVSAAALAQRSTEGAATAQLLADIAPLAQIDPQRVMSRVDIDGAIEVLAEARGAPARVLRSREDAQADREAMAQQAQMAQMAELAPGVARAARDAGMVEGA